jgi:cell division protein FtsW
LLLVVVLSLCGLGVASVYSSASGDMELLKKHLVFLCLACASIGFTAAIPLHSYRKLAPVLYGIAVILLMLVLVPGLGTKIGGARRWFRLGPVNFQPSEFMKFAMVIAVAAWCASRGPDRIRTWFRGFFPAVVLTGLPIFLVAVEPDVGTAIFLTATAWVMLFVAGISLKHVIPTACVVIPLAGMVVIERFGHVARRIEVFLHPERDPQGKGHQILQSMIGLGSGNTSGVGVGLGNQKRQFLPEASTDFIYSSMGEEVGFLGCTLTLVLFALLLTCGARIALSAIDPFAATLALGATFALVFQAAINMAVTTAILPTTGIALPFISYGGSSLVTSGALVGLLMRVGGERGKVRPWPGDETFAQPELV